MEWVLRFLSWLQIVLLRLILQPFFWYRDRLDPPRLPQNYDPLFRLSACELARRIRQGEITSESVVKAYIDRIKEVNPILNAVVEDRYEAALTEARLCDKRLNSGEVTQAQLEIKMPLYGVPFTVKESCSLKGLSHTGCTMVRREIKASADSLIVASMKNAGAIPLCVTNTPELCSNLDSANLLFGQTCNPYDVRRIAGGSSGGEGALLGAGASLIGIGSDIAGSIRIPGLFNGVFGHKPSPGIIPITGHYPMSDDEQFKRFLVLGPMTRYVEDLVQCVRIMSGEQGKKLRLDETVDIKKLRIFYKEDAGQSFGTESVDPSIRRTISRAVTHFETLGIPVSELPVSSLADTFEITVSMFFWMKSIPQLLLNPQDPKHELNSPLEFLKALLGMSQNTKSAIFIKMLKDVRGFISESSMRHWSKKGVQLREKFLEILGDDGVFLYPTFVCTAPPRGQILFQAQASMYCLLANVFGFPATQVPMGLDKEGLPIGFQVIAGPNQDRLCFAVANELEKRFGGWIAPNAFTALQ